MAATRCARLRRACDRRSYGWPPGTSTQFAPAWTGWSTGWPAPTSTYWPCKRPSAPTDQFPTLPFLELGYEVAQCGFNQWNGVAIASRVGLDQVQVGFDGQPSWSSKPEVAATAEARALAATCAGVRVWSLYVPNGRALGDPHYTYKLNWLAALRDTAAGWLRDDPSAQIALVGDWNIAPTDDDVWSVEFFAGRHTCLGTGTQGV